MPVNISIFRPRQPETLNSHSSSDYPYRSETRSVNVDINIDRYLFTNLDLPVYRPRYSKTIAIEPRPSPINAIAAIDSFVD
ncbi:MAG: hypothetical protein SWY16_01560 [Cyanobacteriota bacterium]|nr:hypothetical protein [Cyanobacteriota bacterium]